jgi:hypothetical protein
MKKFIDYCILFAIFVTENHITEDWSTCTKLGKLYYYPFWFIRSTIIWLICPIFMPEFWFKRTKLYKHIQKMQSDPQFQAQLYKSTNNLKL